MVRFDLAASLSQSRKDRTALQALLGKYRNYLYLLARLRLDHGQQVRVDTSDVVQESLMRAVRDFQAFRGNTEAEMMQWLRQILSCTMTDLVRRNRAEKRDVQSERRLEAELEHSSRMLADMLVGSASSPSQTALRHERARLLADAISQLPSDLREVIILRHFENMSLAQVAERMDRTSNSVQKLWSRALMKLHEHLEGEI